LRLPRRRVIASHGVGTITSWSSPDRDRRHGRPPWRAGCLGLAGRAEGPHARGAPAAPSAAGCGCAASVTSSATRHVCGPVDQQPRSSLARVRQGRCEPRVLGPRRRPSRRGSDQAGRCGARSRCAPWPPRYGGSRWDRIPRGGELLIPPLGRRIIRKEDSGRRLRSFARRVVDCRRVGGIGGRPIRGLDKVARCRVHPASRDWVLAFRPATSGGRVVHRPFAAPRRCDNARLAEALRAARRPARP
jgi:hypothetical protein